MIGDTLGKIGCGLNVKDRQCKKFYSLVQWSADFSKCNPTCDNILHTCTRHMLVN